MKKKIFILGALIVGMSFNSFAGTGGANDGVLFTLVLVAFLLLIAGILSTINYFKKNGLRKIISTTKVIIKKGVTILDYFKKVISKRLFALHDS